MPVLTVGKLDRQITIQKPVQTQGATYGEPTQAWTDWATVWANKFESGRELEAARQITGEISTLFQIRWLPGISPTMRISYESRYYDIASIVEVGRRERLNLFAVARLR